ncbi:protein rep [Levilactobacillus brevis]
MMFPVNMRVNGTLIGGIELLRSSYFKSSDSYINQEEWTRLWQKALKVDYEPVVHVQVVKANKRKGTDSLQASAEEREL